MTTATTTADALTLRTADLEARIRENPGSAC
jgi:hypothetical protein